MTAVVINVADAWHYLPVCLERGAHKVWFGFRSKSDWILERSGMIMMMSYDSSHEPLPAGWSVFTMICLC